MIVIRTAEEMARALDSPLDPALLHRLETHRDRLSGWVDYELSELAVFLIVQEGDSVEQAEATFGQKLVRDETFTLLPELVERHGGWIEATFILSDDGFGLVLLAEKGPGADPELMQAFGNAAADKNRATLA